MFSFLTNRFRDKLTIVKVQLLDSLSKHGSELGFWLLFSFFGFTFYLFFNVCLVVALSKWLDSILLALLIVSLLYLLICVNIFFTKTKIKSWIQDTIIGNFSQKFFSDEEQERS